MSSVKTKIQIGSLVVLAGIAVVALFMAMTTHSEQVRIAYVDNARVLAEYKGVIEGTQVFERRTAQWKANLDTLEADVDRSIAQFQQDFPTLSDRERELTQQLIKRKQGEYFSYKEQMDTKIAEEDERITSQILTQIDTYLLEYGETHEYDLILGITERGNLLYSRKSNDITEDIIAGLNKKYEGE